MKVIIQKIFEKDIHKISDKKLASLINDAIEEMEQTTKLTDLRNIKRMIANGNYYRMRIGNYRLGFKVESNTITLLRFMHRKDIYKYFP
ncbi:MAG TPA: type II toxin-antitoxin system RelE/ParE family toxin [Hanamia sp.]|nr:type II toxin-antitoxin system RelE/ParE family toxin [Hanamia sp.]